MYKLGSDDRKRDLPYRFYGLTEYGVELLYEYKYLRGIPVMRAISDGTEKSEKVKRHQNGPRPQLPELVASALHYEEPDSEDIGIKDPDELEARAIFAEGSHQSDNRIDEMQETQEAESDSKKTPEQDTRTFDELFQSDT